MNNEIKERDYDKEPIIVKNYNPFVMYIYTLIIFLLLLLLVFFNPFEIEKDRLYSGVLIMLFLMYPISKRFINFTFDDIMFLNNHIEIRDKNNKLIKKVFIKDIDTIQKTFQTADSNEQSIDNMEGVKSYFAYIFAYIIAPLRILDFIKVIYKKLLFISLFRDRANLNIFDSVFIKSNKKEIINVLINNKELYKELDDYFYFKTGNRLENLEKTFLLFYIDDI